MSVIAKKKERKQREIKNAIVDVDDIKIEPGIKYVNWISLVKTKLREREIILLSLRAKICDEIIITSINNFTRYNAETFEQYKHCVHIEIDRMGRDNLAIYHKEIQNKIINSNSKFMCKCDNVMKDQLTKWNGTRSSKNINTFRQYFKLSKKWFDQIKIDIQAVHFWIQIIKIIQEFTQSAANDFFCNRFFDLQNKYSNYLNILILNNLFVGTMKLPNSRERLLIPVGSFIVFSEEKKQNNQNIQKNKKINGTELRNQMVQEIINKHKIYKYKFQTALLKLHYEVDNYGKTQTLTQSNIDNNNNLNLYKADHHASQKVQDVRYNPY